MNQEHEPKMDEAPAEPGAGHAAGHSREHYDERVERKYLPRRVRPLWGVVLGALALAGGFALQSARRDQNVDLSAPARLPRKIRPPATPIPAPKALPTPASKEASALQDALARADAWAQSGAKAPAQPSLMVCEPIVTASGASVPGAQAFGAGCARWLHLNAAGDPSLGATPLWHRVEYARLASADSRRLAAGPRAAFRVGADDVAGLYRATGATRIALGRLQPGASPKAPAVLSFEVLDAPSGRRLAALEVKGTPALIAQQLPSLARRLRLAASTSALVEGAIPARCELSARELEAVGAAPWSTWYVSSRAEKASDAQVRALEKLAPRSSLAALEMVNDYPYTFGDRRYRTAVAHLLRLAPRNALAWAAASLLDAGSLRARGRELDALCRRFPASSALCIAQAYVAELKGEPELAYNWASRTLSLAPRDPMCWRVAAGLTEDRAQALRQGRFSASLSRQEWQQLNRWYSMALFCHAHALSLDQRDSRSWAGLCRAATFTSQEEVSLAALWRGLSIDPENYDLCSWALQMLQPKWTRRTELLPVIISHIERVRPLFESLHGDAIQALANSDAQVPSYGAEANLMLSRTTNRLQDEARLRPDNPVPHLALAHFAKRFGLRDTQYATWERELRTYLALCPWDAAAHFDLGWMLQYKKGEYPGAQGEYQAALKIKPDFPAVLASQADLLISAVPHHADDNARAQALLRRAIALDDVSTYHVQLGLLLLDKGDKAGARREALAAVARGYNRGDRLFSALNIQPAKS